MTLGATKEREPETELGEVLDEVEEALGEDARQTLEVAIIRKALGDREEDAETETGAAAAAAAAEEGA